jgi:guanidinopropionase
MTRPNNDQFQPIPGLEVPRFAGVATFMRLPQVKLEEAGDVDIGLIGVPWDGGTTNRPGPRHGPRQMRDASAMIRPGASPPEDRAVQAGQRGRPW